MSEYWIKLRGLPYRTTMDDIIEFLTDVNIKGNKRGIFFPISQKNIEWGEAFIELDSEEDLERAKSKHNQHMGRRYIEVFTSSRSDMDNACNVQKVSVAENGRDKNMQRRPRSRSPARPRLSENYVIRMKGLPFNASKGDIKEFFQGLKILPDGMSILVDQNGKALGDAFVQFATYHDSKIAKERTGSKIGHRYIEVFDSNIEEANNEIRRQMEINDMRLDPFDKSPPRSRSSRVIDDVPIAPSRRYARSYLINMRGVAINVRPDDVFKFFRPLMPVSVVMKFISTSAEGEADVEFPSEEEAYSAMSRDRERLGSGHVSLSLVNSSDDFGYSGEPGGYDRREVRALPPSRGYPDRDGPYPPSRYY